MDTNLTTPTRQWCPCPPLNKLPPEIAAVCARMRSLGLPCPGDQCIINEYGPGHGIGAHVDLLPDFGDAVASVSLNGWCTMILHPLPPRRGRRPVKFFLPPGSLLILEGEARQLWAHSIPKSRDDVDSSGRRWPRSRRVSVTLRSMNKFPCPPNPRPLEGPQSPSGEEEGDGGPGEGPT